LLVPIFHMQMKRQQKKQLKELYKEEKKKADYVNANSDKLSTFKI
jgi:hypothetical protein